MEAWMPQLTRGPSDKAPNKPNERKNMNSKFDELAKGLAQSATRRQALKKFSVGLAGMALACLGLAGVAQAGGKKNCLGGYSPCTRHTQCCSGICYQPTLSSGLVCFPVYHSV
jgi:hypothetical protein